MLVVTKDSWQQVTQINRHATRPVSTSSPTEVDAIPVLPSGVTWFENANPDPEK